MSSLKPACAAAMLLCAAILMGGVTAVFGQTNYFSTSGTEYAVVGSLHGDQMFPNEAISPSGGYLVWQDNITDGSGWGISAERLDSTFSGTLGNFRVNVQGTNDQVNPKVALLKNGGAAFVWQGGATGKQHIYARFLSPSNTWLSTTDVVVSTFATFQTTAALTVLNDGNVVVVWSSYNQASSSSLLDVYASIFTPAGVLVSNQFLVNQFSSYNQRSPAVTALSTGGFAVAWISEQENKSAANFGSNSVYQTASSFTQASVDVYARLYSSNGVPTSSEIQANVSSNPCSAPVLASAPNGGFLIAWSAKDLQTLTNGWDIYARPFSSAGVGTNISRVNSHLNGDQYAPQVSSLGSEFMVIWTSLGQDGSREGVFGQYVHDDGALVGTEFPVNTTTIGQQMQPAVASDGSAWFQVVWTTFTGYVSGFDLNAQRFANVASVLQPMNAPYVYAPFTIVGTNYLPQLIVSWPSLPGVSVANFQIFVDGSTTATNLPVTTNQFILGGLTPNSTHSFQIGYVTAAGAISPVSPSASGTTWAQGNDNGVPIEWLENYYGYNFANWPANVNAPLVRGGPSLLSIFLSGGNPLDPTTWLLTSVVRTSGGMYLNWNTQPGMTYQVQQSAQLGVWTNLGSARFAAGTSDSIYVGGTPVGYFRVVLLRQ